MPKMLSTLFLLTYILLPAYAGEISQAHVDYDEGHYLVKLVMKIDAEPETVYAILMDFDHLSLVNKSIKHSKLLKSEGKRHMILIEAEGCIWFFCKTVKQVQWVTENGNGYISAVTLPERSNLEYGRVLWHIRQQDEATIISYHTDIVPAFFVPPLIGPYLMKSRMLEEAEKTIQNIEKLAQQDENY